MALITYNDFVAAPRRKTEGSFQTTIFQFQKSQVITLNQLSASDESKFFQPYRIIDIIIDAMLTTSSNIPAQEPTTMSYTIHSGELTHSPTIRIFRALYVYPPIVAAILAATGSIDHQPLQVKISVAICNMQSKPHVQLLLKERFLLPKQNERTVFST